MLQNEINAIINVGLLYNKAVVESDNLHVFFVTLCQGYPDSTMQIQSDNQTKSKIYEI